MSGASEMLGQQVYQGTRPETLAFVGTGAGIAATGNHCPQIALPEEIITVPAAAAARLRLVLLRVNMNIESGLAYKELTEAGVPRDKAAGISAVVGGANALLEGFQVDELVKGFRILNAAGLGKDTVAKNIAKALKERGIDVAKEVAQEVAQKGVTIAGSNIGRYSEGLQTDTAQEVLGRLGETDPCIRAYFWYYERSGNGSECCLCWWRKRKSPATATACPTG